MVREDLELLDQLGKALLLDENLAQKTILDTVTALSLVSLTRDQSTDRAVRILYEKAKRTPVANRLTVYTNILSDPFYQLSLEQKMVLICLHLGQWKYHRIGLVLNCSPKEVEILAWRARIDLCAGGRYPHAPVRVSSNCPEYQLTHPWTQQFMDEQFARAQERALLQNHLIACESCRQALDRCRDLYYQVEKKIHLTLGESEFAEALEAVLNRSPILYQKTTSGLAWQALVVALKRWDVRLGFVMMMILLLLHSLWK